MATDPTPDSRGAPSNSKVSAVVIGVGVGLAAGLAAPVLAGVGFSAVGFTTAGVVEGSLASSWKETGGSLFRLMQSTAHKGISGSVAAGLGATLGTAAAVLTLFVKRKKTEPSFDQNQTVTQENLKTFEKLKTDELSEQVVRLQSEAPDDENAVTAKEMVVSSEEVKQLSEKKIERNDIHKKESTPDSEQLPICAVEEQLVQATVVLPKEACTPQCRLTEEEQLREQDATSTSTDAEVEEVVVEAVIKLPSFLRQEKVKENKDTKKMETTDKNLAEEEPLSIMKSETPTVTNDLLISENKGNTTPALMPQTVADVCCTIKFEREAESLKAALDQVVEIKNATEELPHMKECLEREENQPIIRELEILPTTETSLPAESPELSSLAQELTVPQNAPISNCVHTREVIGHIEEQVNHQILNSAEDLESSCDEERPPLSLDEIDLFQNSSEAPTIDTKEQSLVEKLESEIIQLEMKVEENDYQKVTEAKEESITKEEGEFIGSQQDVNEFQNSEAQTVACAKIFTESQQNLKDEEPSSEEEEESDEESDEESEEESEEYVDASDKEKRQNVADETIKSKTDSSTEVVEGDKNHDLKPDTSIPSADTHSNQSTTVL